MRSGSELITLHSHTPLHLLDEGILADGRFVFASVPHGDGSRAIVLVDCLALRDVQDSAFCFSDEQWEISVLCRIRGSGCHVEGIHPPSRPLAPSQSHASHTARGSRSLICRTLHTLGTFTPLFGSTRMVVDISRNLPSLLVTDRNVCHANGDVL